jgi:hypothetical protein
MGRPLCGQEVMKATGGRSSPTGGHGKHRRKLGVMELRELAFYERLGREVGEEIAFQTMTTLAGAAVARTTVSWGVGVQRAVPCGRGVSPGMSGRGGPGAEARSKGLPLAHVAASGPRRPGPGGRSART